MFYVILFCILTIVIYFYIYIPYNYKLPISDHSDGKKFFNLNHKSEQKKTFGKFLKWMLEIRKTRAKWPERVEVDQYDVPPNKIEDDNLRVSFIGHVSFLIQTNSINIVTDPVYSKRASMFEFIGPKRVIDPGIKFEDLPKIDLVLISHNHYDHLDIRTLKKLWKRDDPLFITPLRNDDLIRSHIPNARIISLDWHQNTRFNKDIDIGLEPSHHWSSRWGLDKDRMLWGTFVINTPSGSIIFIGDTGYDDKIFKEIGRKYPNIILSLIPIGAYEPRYIMQNSHVNPNESVLVHKDLKSKKSIASHYMTFQLTDEAYDKPSADLKIAIRVNNIHENDFITLKVGEVIVLK
jgi:L-ascorbate metabolism protein UlaG (beta-lactamase superfamily)